MLVLSRQRDEVIMIGDDIEVTVCDIRGDKCRLGINAPKATPIHRKEVYDAIRRENRTNKESIPKSHYTEDNPPLMGDAALNNNLATDEQWWEGQIQNYPQMRVHNGIWTVAVAPLDKTISTGKTFAEAVHRCREMFDLVHRIA